VYHSHGKYYYVTKDKKWLPLGADLPAARVEWAKLEGTDNTHYLNMDAAIDKYLNECLYRKAKKTQVGNRLEAETLRKVFGQMTPADIAPSDVYEFMLARGKQSEVRANRERSLLSSIMSMCCTWGYCRFNPVREVKPFAEFPRTRYVTDEEFAATRLLAPLLVQAMMDLALLTAQRSQDLLALRLDSIKDDGLHIVQLKGRNKRRIDLTILWTSPLRATVDALQNMPRPYKSLFLVTSKNGSQLSEYGWRTAWQRTINKAVAAGIERFHFHDIRAKTITELEKAGINAQDLSGHTSRDMINRVYNRLTSRKVNPLR